MFAHEELSHVETAAFGAMMSRIALPPLALLLLALPVPGQAQRIAGEVRDAVTGHPIPEALVRADSTGAVALTGADGTFTLRPVPPGVQTVTVQAFGYETSVVSVRTPSDDPVVVEMQPRPVDVEGLRARAKPFATRFEETQTVLDRRVARLPGDIRIARPSEIRPYDEGHRRDPWAFMSDVMRILPVLDEDMIRVRGFQSLVGKIQQPEVYLDDKRVWLLDVVLRPLSELCRVEFYTPPPNNMVVAPQVEVPTQLRTYTCAFLADVANGQAEMRTHINHGDLIAGPGGG